MLESTERVVVYDDYSFHDPDEIPDTPCADGEFMTVERARESGRRACGYCYPFMYDTDRYQEDVPT